MRRNLVAAVVVLGLGAGCLAGAAVAKTLIGGFLSSAATAEGEVIGLAARGKGKSPVVAFAGKDGRRVTFTSANASNPPDYHVGQRVEVLYRPDAPGEPPRIRAFFEVWTPVVVLVVMSLIFTAVGAVLLGGVIGARRRRTWLRRHGQRVRARVTDVEPVPGSRVARYRVCCEWTNPETQLKAFFTSDEMSEEPAVKAGEEVDVLVDTNDDTRYMVDLSPDGDRGSAGG